MPVTERRVLIVPWPREMERRTPHLTIRERLLRAACEHAISTAMAVLLLGTIGLVVGTAYGSRPAWPAPFVFYVTAFGTIGALIHALVRPARQPRIAAVLGVITTGGLRGTAFALQGLGVGDADRQGLVLAAVAGAYLMVVGLGMIVISQAFGETIGGSHRKWDG